MRAEKSILIVDDDPGIRALYQKVLAVAGYSVRQAEDGNAAISVMEACPIDLVLVDMLMPGKDGIGAIMEFKDRWPDCIILAMSGGGWIDGDDCLKLARLAGAHAVIRKPLPLGDLVDKIAQALSTDLKVHAA